MSEQPKITIFSTCQCMAFIGNEQVPELQRSYPELLAEHAERMGYDPDGWIIKMPTFRVRLLKTEYGYNYEIIE